MIFKMFANGSIRVELGSPDFSFLWLSSWVNLNKNVIFYFILFTCWALVFSLGYEFKNSKAYYGPQGYYVGPSPSASSTCGIGS